MACARGGTTREVLLLIAAATSAASGPVSVSVASGSFVADAPPGAAPTAPEEDERHSCALDVYVQLPTGVPAPEENLWTDEAVDGVRWICTLSSPPSRREERTEDLRLERESLRCKIPCDGRRAGGGRRELIGPVLACMRDGCGC